METLKAPLKKESAILPLKQSPGKSSPVTAYHGLLTLNCLFGALGWKPWEGGEQDCLAQSGI